MDITFTEMTSLLPILRKVVEFLLSRISSSRQEEEHSFRERFSSSGSFLCFFAEFGNSVSSEGDTGIGVKARTVIEHNGQSSHTEDSIINFDFTDNGVGVQFSELGEF